jgi:hypothetical protein
MEVAIIPELYFKEKINEPKEQKEPKEGEEQKIVKKIVEPKEDMQEKYRKENTLELRDLRSELMKETVFWRQILMIGNLFTYRSVLILAFIIHQEVRCEYKKGYGYSYYYLEGDDKENAVWTFKADSEILEHSFDDAVFHYLQRLRRNVTSKKGLKVIEKSIDEWLDEYTNKLALMDKVRPLLFKDCIKLPDNDRSFLHYDLEEVDGYIIKLENKYNDNLIEYFVKYNLKKNSSPSIKKLYLSDIYNSLTYLYPSDFFKAPTKEYIIEKLKSYNIIINETEILTGYKLAKKYFFDPNEKCDFEHIFTWETLFDQE